MKLWVLLTWFTIDLKPLATTILHHISQLISNVASRAEYNTVEPVYYGHLGTNQKFPDYHSVLIFQVSLCDKAPCGTLTM